MHHESLGNTMHPWIQIQIQNQIIILTALTAGRLHSWGGSEKQAFNLSSDRKSLAAREPESGGRFFRARAVRFMFRARPFVIMAECKQTDIIWRLLHPPGSAIVTRTKLAEETPRKGQRGFLMNTKGVTMWLQHRTRMNHLLQKLGRCDSPAKLWVKKIWSQLTPQCIGWWGQVVTQMSQRSQVSRMAP